MSVNTQSKAFATTFATDSPAIRWASYVVLVLLGTALMAIAAKTKVPFFPVPMTLQTLAVFGIAAAYGRNLAVATMVAYLIEGFMGLPVFAGDVAGPAYLGGATAGYLLGFVVAAAIVGEAADRGFSRHPFKMFSAMLAADIIVFALGFLWLATFIGTSKAFFAGVAPFVFGDVVKIAIASLLVAALWKVFRK